ncbi:MAG: hypothetical protein SAJ72_03850 [Jaaginema sp. PMC 1080.18]|nr:hypothetical protein [Jaaginema sp. PMC 1080.18]MEC4865941.1 hypothetical protein [Jaaginema sp. PMC 1078.18]
MYISFLPPLKSVRLRAKSSTLKELAIATRSILLLNGELQTFMGRIFGNIARVL